LACLWQVHVQQQRQLHPGQPQAVPQLQAQGSAPALAVLMAPNPVSRPPIDLPGASNLATLPPLPHRNVQGALGFARAPEGAAPDQHLDNLGSSYKADRH